MAQKLKWTYPWLKIALLAVVCSHIYFWRGHSVAMVKIMFRHVVGVATLPDYLRAGTICNSLGEYSCSVQSFQQILMFDSRNLPALGNLALLNTKMKRYEESLKYYNKYVEFGGAAADVLNGFGVTLMNVGNAERGIALLYKSAFRDPSQISYAVDLVDYLMMLGRKDEALSVIGSITFGQPEKHSFWHTKLIAISSQEVRLPTAHDVQLVRLPSLTQGYFYLPAQIKLRGEYMFFAIDPESKDNRRPASAAADPTVPEKLSLHVGPWQIDEQKFSECEGCDWRLGADFLERFQVNQYSEEGIDFIEFAYKN